MFHDYRDFQKQYHKRVPKMFRDYCESGSWQEETLSANMADFKKIKFRQRVARNIETRSLETSLPGHRIKMPVIGAPVGLLGMQYPDGEIHAARSFAEFGVPFTLSTMSICSIEDVARASTAPFWFQLYIQRDRDFTNTLVQRAKAAACSALVVTLDLQIIGKRHADARNGMTAPPRLSPRNMIDIALHPRWALGMLGTSRRGFGNIEGYVASVENMNDLMAWTKSQFEPRVNWEDVKRHRDQWPGIFILKGILDKDDARHALEVGADMIVVSNHGGRQLDGAPSSISRLPEIAKAVGDRIPILLDGGVRSGQDVLRARALGATAVMIGRPMVYALGAAGGQGVTKLLEIFYEELDLSMAFMGHQSIDAVSGQDVIQI